MIPGWRKYLGLATLIITDPKQLGFRGTMLPYYSMLYFSMKSLITFYEGLLIGGIVGTGIKQLRSLLVAYSMFTFAGLGSFLAFNMS
jgi:hypothetical protein